jgi:hypothetical protein
MLLIWSELAQHSGGTGSGAAGTFDHPLHVRFSRAPPGRRSGITYHPRHRPVTSSRFPLCCVRTGKRLEMPVKRPLQGVGPTAVVDLGALGYPDALAAFAPRGR